MRNEKLRRILAELKAGLSELYGDRLAQLVLFGSHARRDAEEGSDIDVLVVLRGHVNAGDEIERSGDIVARLSLDNDVVVSCVFFNEDDYLRRNGPLLRNVRREGVRL